MKTATRNQTIGTAPTRSVGVKVLVSVMYLVIFMVVWIACCAAADYWFYLGADAWRMTWGFFAGTAAFKLADLFYERYTR